MASNRTSIGALALSAAGLVAVILSEGYSPTPVVPVPGDRPTIGFGSANDVKPGEKITPPAAVARAYSEMARYEGAIKQCVKVPLYQHEYDVYVSMAYNIGPGAFCSSTLVRKLNALDYAGACAEIKRWNKVKGRVVNGLTVRREREYQQCTGQK